MPNKNATASMEEKGNIDITAESISKFSDPFGMAKDFLTSEKGKSLLKEIRDIQDDLQTKGLNFEDYLIVGTQTLKEATKNWDKMGLNSKDKIACYAALYIGGCAKKDVPVTFICPQKDLKVTEKNFNNKDILKWKGDVEGSIWDKIWDTICTVLHIKSPLSKEKANQEHRIKVDGIRTANLQKKFMQETAEKYKDAKKMVDEVAKEEKKWGKLFLKEGEKKLPDISKELREQLPESYKYMSPIEICMGLASKRVSFSDSMTPEDVKEDKASMNMFKEAGELYRSLVQDGKMSELKDELNKICKPMSFDQLGNAMEMAVAESHIGPAIEVEENGRTIQKVNEKYNPLGDADVRKKMIQMAPMLKHCNIQQNENTLSIGTLMAKEWYGLMENSAKMCEAVREQRISDFVPLASNIAHHRAFYVLFRNATVLNTSGTYKLCVNGQDRNLGAILGKPAYHQITRNFGSNFKALLKKEGFNSPFGVSMMLAKGGLDGSLDQLSYAEKNPLFIEGLNMDESKRYHDPTIIRHFDDVWMPAGRIIPERANKAIADATAQANKDYGDIEIQKAAESQSIEKEEPEMIGPSK